MTCSKMFVKEAVLIGYWIQVHAHIHLQEAAAVAVVLLLLINSVSMNQRVNNVGNIYVNFLAMAMGKNLKTVCLC